jgi:hypothetical protein
MLSRQFRETVAWLALTIYSVSRQLLDESVFLIIIITRAATYFGSYF